MGERENFITSHSQRCKNNSQEHTGNGVWAMPAARPKLALRASKPDGEKEALTSSPSSESLLSHFRLVGGQT